MYHKRRFIPKNLDKYEGDHTKIIMRSSWETRFANWCDRTPSVIKWKSEETIVPYRSPVDQRIHRYFIDFQIQVRDKDGRLKTYLVEIKPDSQCKPPKYPGRKTQRYLTEAQTFMINQAKWKAASAFAKDRNWEFIVLTEHHLGIA